MEYNGVLLSEISCEAKPIPLLTEEVRGVLDGRRTQIRRVMRPQPVLDGHFWRWHGAGWSDNIKRITPVYGHSMYNKAPYQPGDKTSIAFRDASPPSDGWYFVRWEPGDKEQLVWLAHVPDEPQDVEPEHDFERWVWGKSPHDDPEAVGLDIADPPGIAWRRPGDILWVRETTFLYGKWVKNGFTTTGRQKWRFAWDKSKPVFYMDNPPDAVETKKTEVGYFKRPSIHMPREAARLFLLVRNVCVGRLQEMDHVDAQCEGVEMASDDELQEYGYRAGFKQLWDSLYVKHGYSWESNPWVWVIEFEKTDVYKGDCFEKEYENKSS